MALEKNQHEGEPKAREGLASSAARRSAAEDIARAFTDNPYETGRDLAERLGVPFMTYEQAKQQGLIVKNNRGNWEPAQGYRFVDDPARREKHLRNWAVRKLEVDPRERARQKGLPFMTHEEAVRKNLVIKNAKGNWEPAPNYEWVDHPNKSNNWAVKRKHVEPMPAPAPKPETPRKVAPPKKAPRPTPKPAPIVKAKPSLPKHVHRQAGPLPPPAPEPDITHEEYRLTALSDALEDLHGDLEELDNLHGFIYTSIYSGNNYRITFTDDDYVKIEIENPIYPETWTPAPETGLIKISNAEEIANTLLMLDATLYQTPDSTVTPAPGIVQPEGAPITPEKITTYNERYRERAKMSIRIFLRDHSPARKEGIERWTNALVHEIESQKLPLTPQVLTLILTVIARESGFQTEPRVGDMNAMYARLKQKARTEHRILFGAAEFLLDDAEAKYKPKLAEVKTEKDLENLASEVLADPLMDKVKSIIIFGDQIYAKIHEELDNVVGTVGSMQVNAKKALEIAKREGKNPTEKEIREELYTLEGGIHYGIAMLAEAVKAYDKEDPGFNISDTHIKLVLADYNGGLYTCRNAAVQAQLSELTGNNLAKDGDLLAYDKEGHPLVDPSGTEQVFRKFVTDYSLGISDIDIRQQLLKEKSPDFENTTLYASVRREYQNKFPSKDVLAAIYPQAKTGYLRGEIKFGINLSTSTYYAARIRAYRDTLKRIERYYA